MQQDVSSYRLRWATSAQSPQTPSAPAPLAARGAFAGAEEPMTWYKVSQVPFDARGAFFGAVEALTA